MIESIHQFLSVSPLTKLVILYFFGHYSILFCQMFNHRKRRKWVELELMEVLLQMQGKHWLQTFRKKKGLKQQWYIYTGLLSFELLICFLNLIGIALMIKATILLMLR